MEGGYSPGEEEGPRRMGRKGGTEKVPALVSVPSGGADGQVVNGAKGGREMAGWACLGVKSSQTGRW